MSRSRGRSRDSVVNHFDGGGINSSGEPDSSSAPIDPGDGLAHSPFRGEGWGQNITNGLRTSTSNELLVMMVFGTADDSGIHVTGVTDDSTQSLVWRKRASKRVECGTPGRFVFLEVWFAVVPNAEASIHPVAALSSAPLIYRVTGQTVRDIGFLSEPFDTNASLPAIEGQAASYQPMISVSTTATKGYGISISVKNEDGFASYPAGNWGLFNYGTDDGPDSSKTHYVTTNRDSIPGALVGDVVDFRSSESNSISYVDFVRGSLAA